MASITQAFAPGPYTVSYAGTDIGETEGVKRLQMQTHGREVRCDKFGERIVDVIDRGQDWFVQMVLKEWDAAIEAALYPFGTVIGNPDAPVAGGLYTGKDAALVLVAMASSPAATTGPGPTITFTAAIIAPNQMIDIPLGSDERNVPVTFLCFPDDDGDVLTET